MFARIIEYVHRVRKHHRHYLGITMLDMLLGGISLGLCLAGIAVIVTALSSLLPSVAFIFADLQGGSRRLARHRPRPESLLLS